MARGSLFLSVGILVASAYGLYLLFSSTDDRDDRPPRSSQSYDSSRPPALWHAEQQPQQNIHSPQRPNHAPAEGVQASIRSKARQEDDYMTQHNRQIKERRDYDRAKVLSEEGKRLALETKDPNAGASAAIFSENDRDRRIIDSSQRPDRVPAGVIQASPRTQARQGDLTVPFYPQVRERRDHVCPKAPSEEGKRYVSEMENPNAGSSATIFSENNQDQQVIDSSQRPDRVPAGVIQASPRTQARQGDLTVPFYPKVRERRDHVCPKAPSEEGKRYVSEMENPNAGSSATIFSENNQDQQVIDSFQTPGPTLGEDVQSLRAKAKREAELMSQSLQRSHDAYERGDHPGAKGFSEEGKRHALKMKEFNAEASAAIYNENNKDRAACEVDLHRLYVKEAIVYSKKAVTEARRRGDPEVRLIVGRGIHSDENIPRLKPAIQKAMRRRRYHVEVDPKNAGVLVVQLSDE